MARDRDRHRRSGALMVMSVLAGCAIDNRRGRGGHGTTAFEIKFFARLDLSELRNCDEGQIGAKHAAILRCPRRLYERSTVDTTIIASGWSDRLRALLAGVR